MEDRVIMSKKELQRKSILDAHLHGKLSLLEASIRLDIGYRQVKRIWRSYQAEGDLGLIHKSRGKISPHAYPQAFKTKVLEHYRTKYLDYGPTYAAEKLLADDLISIHPETLRLWLKENNLWTKMRKRKVHREQRPRRLHFGDLLQIDGSIHDWFGAAEKHCLLNIVDDATGISFALLDKGETTQILLTVLKKWIEMYGIPKAVYVDLKSVYVSPKRMKEKFDDDLLIGEGYSVFEEVCKDLDIQIIKAYSAQAKGRVERKHGVFQDRLVKDIQLYNIRYLDEANKYLEEKFLPHINNKFAKAPMGGDGHRDAESYGDLDEIICWRYRRQVKNDWTIQFKRQYYQIHKESNVQPQAIITLKKYLNGSHKLWFEGRELGFHLLERKPIPPSKTKKYYKVKGPQSSEDISRRSRKNKHKSPFSQFNPGYLSNKNRIYPV